MKEYLSILRAARHKELPEAINSSGSHSIEYIKELYDAGYLSGIDASDADGLEYLDIVLTASGRELLARLEADKQAGTLASHTKRAFVPIMKWVFGIVGTILAAIIVAYFTINTK